MNAFEIPNLRFSLVAGGAIERHRFVKVDTDGNGVVAGAGEMCIGASMNKVASGQVLEIADGIVVVEASAAIAAGATIQVAATGKAVTLSSGIAAGVALTAAGAAGEFIAVKMINAVSGAAGADAKTLMVVNYQAADLAAGADIADTGFAIVPAGYSATVVSAQVVAQGSAAGIDASNTSVFSLKGDTTEFAAITFDGETAFPADGVAQALTLGAAGTLALTAGTAIKIGVTNAAAADLPLFLVQVVLELVAAA